MLAQALVGSGHHRDLGHALHVGQQLLDLGGAHVLAAPDDDVLQPVGDGQVAVGVDDADVAGVEPAVLVDRLGRERGVGVAGEAVGATGEDLARLADADVVAVLVDRADLDPLERPAVGVDPLLPGRLVLGTGDRRVLGAAVGAHERDPELVGPLGHRVRGWASRPAR